MSFHRVTTHRRRFYLVTLSVSIVLLAVLFMQGRSASADPSLIINIPVGSNPYAVGVNSTTNRIYTANFSSASVSVIDGSSNTVIATVPVGAFPRGIGVNATTNRVYATNYNSHSVSVIDGSTNIVAATISVGANPYGVGVNATTNRIYAANYSDDTLSVIDGSTNSVVGTVAVGDGPHGVGVNATTNRIYVANYNSDTLSVIDSSTNTVITTLGVGGGPETLSINQTTNRIYVANNDTHTVSVIDGSTNTVITTLGVGLNPRGIGVNPLTNRIYVCNYSGASMSVIDGNTNTLITTVNIGYNFIGLDVNATTNLIYLANYAGGVRVFGEPIYNSVPAPSSNIDVGYSPIGTTVTNTTSLAVSNTGTGPLVVSSMTVTGRDAADFTISPFPDFTSNSGSPSQVIALHCTPSGLGVRLATLTIPHNGYSSDATYTLICAGLPALPTATPTNTPTATPTHTPTNTPTPTAISLLPTNTLQPRSRTPVPLFNGLRGFYFDNSDFTNLVLSRLDTTVDFNWLTGSPDVSIGTDTFSVRWTGMVVPQYSQPYKFYVEADGGVRLWVNNVKIIDNWSDANTTRTSTAITLAAGQYYRIQLEYYENTGNAKAILSWSSTSQTKQIIPSARLFTR